MATNVVFERAFAIELANKVLDNPHLDPDGDLSVLARQFLRETERFAYVQADEREACAKIADAKAAEVAEGSCSWGTANMIAEAIRARGGGK